MKTKIINTLPAVFTVLSLIFLQACYDDKGNYDYEQLDEIVIDTTRSNILPDYALYRYDTIEIEPKVYYNGVLLNEDNTDYANDLDIIWSVFQAVTGGNVYTRDTLSTGIKLSAQITKPAGKWIVLLTVRQRRNDVETYMRFNLQVDEILSDGWMVLYERDGNTDVGLIVDDYIKKGVIRERTFVDVYSAANGKPLSGSPKEIIHSVAPIQSREVLIASSNELAGVNYTSFEITHSFKDLFWDVPQSQSPSYLGGNSGRRELVINDNRIHYVNFMSSGLFRTNYFGDACRGDYGKLAEWAATCYSSSFDAVVYDQDYKRFRCVNYGAVEVVGFQAQDPATTAFDVNNVGMEFLVSDWGRNNYEYSIMKNDNEYALLLSNFYNGELTGLGTGKYDMSACPDISSVSSLAAAVDGEYIYYSTGGSLYIYKYNTNEAASKVWTAPANEIISCVKTQKFYYPQFDQLFLPYRNKVVYVATWNETTKNGKVYEYIIDASNGAINTDSERIKEGFGKIKDMSWKWTL
jgi:hypothetical protein